jgi:DnaK suppressor protein
VAKKAKKTTKRKTCANTKAVKKSIIKRASSKKTEPKTQKVTARKPAERKSSKKKTSVRKKTSRIRRKSTLTAAEIKNFKRMLLEKWFEIVGDVSLIENEALKKSRLDAAGDLSSMPIHMADIGTDNFEQEFALGLMDSERKLLVEIRDALKRISEKVYGICEGTGKVISKARLKANPWARYCIEYANMVEKGLVEEGQYVYGKDQKEEDEYGLTEEEDEDFELNDEYEDEDEEDEPEKVFLDDKDKED